MKTKITALVIMFFSLMISSSVFAEGYLVTSDLWIRAVINTVEKGPVDAVFYNGGKKTTSRGDTVIWGYFYASPDDVSWGDQGNPDLYVKIWFDVSGRIDVNYFHVSVPDIEVYSDYPYDGTWDQHGTTTMDYRYIRHEYGTTYRTTYRIADYFPLAQGDTWTIREEDDEGISFTIRTISGTEYIAGVNAPKMIDEDGDYDLFTNSNGITHYKYKSCDVDENPDCGWSQEVFNPPVVLIPAEISIGSIYTFNSTYNYTECTGFSESAPFSVETRVEGLEDVTVPAGTFTDCLKININKIINYPNTPFSNEITLWLAKGVGEVKELNLEIYNGVVNENTDDLISATVNGIDYP